MEQLTLSVSPRVETGKGPNRRLRANGQIPGVIYGLGDQKVVALSPKLVEKSLLGESGKNTIFSLQGEGLDGKHALIKEYQVDPVSRQLLHVDLYEIDVQQKVDVTIPLHLTGKSVGVVEGGILNVIERTIEVSCLPTQIPKHIDIDVTELKIGDSVHLEDLKLPEGLEKVSQSNPTLVACVPPAKEEDAQAALGDEKAEPEVITEKKKEEDDKAGDAKDKK